MTEFGPIPQFAPFLPEVDPASTAQRWKKWTDRVENLMTALNINDAKRKRALLLHLAGEAVYDIFEGLVVESPPEDTVSCTAFPHVTLHSQPFPFTRLDAVLCITRVTCPA